VVCPEENTAPRRCGQAADPYLRGFSAVMQIVGTSASGWT
jgi:hypothetical protein